MTDQDARDLIARLRMASEDIAAQCRRDGSPGPEHRHTLTWKAADALDRLLRERASLRAQIIEEAAQPELIARALHRFYHADLDPNEEFFRGEPAWKFYEDEGEAVAAALRTLAATPAASRETAPGHTDLMISPEAIDEALANEAAPGDETDDGDETRRRPSPSTIEGEEGR